MSFERGIIRNVKARLPLISEEQRRASPLEATCKTFTLSESCFDDFEGDRMGRKPAEPVPTSKTHYSVYLSRAIPLMF